VPDLSILIWLPLATGLLGTLLPQGSRGRTATPATAPGGEVRRPLSTAGLVALLGALATFGLSIWLLAGYKPGGGLQDLTDTMWICSASTTSSRPRG
jgi:hypothetical protein